MFCPRCSAENGLEQAYCRQCGLGLSDVRLALQGVATESLAKLQSGSDLMNGGIATLAVFMMIAVTITLIAIFLGHPALIAIAMINAALGALIGLPLVMVGKSRVTQASRLLSGEASAKAIDSPRGIRSPDPAVQSEMDQLNPPRSVTEHTTLDLRGRRDV